MRVEGDGDAPCAEFAGAAAGVLDDPAMAAVDAVKIADGDDGGAVVGGEFVERAEDLLAAPVRLLCEDVFVPEV